MDNPAATGSGFDGVPAGAKAPLGNYTKSSPPQTGPEPSNHGALRPVRKGKKNARRPDQKKTAEARALRYECQAEARRLMLSAISLTDTPGKRRKPLTHDDYKRAHRVCKCRWMRVKPEVEVHQSKQYGSCHYGGLAVCGSVWACPVCGGRIQERRRLEICTAMDEAYNQGLTCTMVTLTFPHTAFDSCKELLTRQRDALTRFRRGKAYDQLREQIGYIGLIRALEVTHGANGWHPHTHELWFHEPGKARGMITKIKKLWEAACRKAGLIPAGKLTAFRKHAVHVMYGAQSGDYLAKSSDQGYWGADSELSRSRLKVGGKGRPPFAILHDSAKGCKRSGELFTEYVYAFNGKRQLYWTNGLKDRFLIDEIDDETLAAEQTEAADMLGQLDAIAWELVRLNGARALVLDLAERLGWAGVIEWFSDHGYRVSATPPFPDS